MLTNNFRKQLRSKSTIKRYSKTTWLLHIFQDTSWGAQHGNHDSVMTLNKSRPTARRVTSIDLNFQILIWQRTDPRKPSWHQRVVVILKSDVHFDFKNIVDVCCRCVVTLSMRTHVFPWWRVQSASRVIWNQLKVNNWAPSQYKDRLIYVWRFPC